jgi:NAD+ kinase
VTDSDGRTRTVLLIAHTGRPQAVDVACAVSKRLMDSAIAVRLLADDESDLVIPHTEAVTSGPDAARDCEIAVVLGGDGTILRGAALTRLVETPLLGINLGHVGFLAEAEWDDVESTVDAIIGRDYQVEERMTVDVTVMVEGRVESTGWALNEVSVEKAARQRMLEMVVEIDDRPLSRWGCDGVVFATPTGSTAYAFSAGGPVVWPEVEALLLVPISAHALFARPMVASPESTLAVELLAPADGGVMWCDGRRSVDLSEGARVEVRRGARPIHLARIHRAPFTDRLVAKFDLPVSGWRGAAERRRSGGAG